MVLKPMPAIEFDRRIPAIHLEMEDMRPGLARRPFGEPQGLRTDPLAAVGPVDEELVDPGAAAAVFQAVVEAQKDVPKRLGRGLAGIAEEPGLAHQWRRDERFEILQHTGIVEGYRPRIVVLHGAHQSAQFGNIRTGGLTVAEGHGIPL